MKMNSMMLFGIILIVIGVGVFAVSQVIIRNQIQKYNREWNEGVESNDVS